MTLGPSWRDHDDRPVDRPAPPGPDAPPFYAPIGDFQGEHYRRNAFAKGTVEEADALWRRLDLVPGQRVLDVGSGDGRHLRAFAARGVAGLGVDISAGLVAAAGRAAADAGLDDVRFVVGDARRLSEVDGVEPGGFDVVMSVCQGGFGTSPTSDPEVVRGLAAAVRPGGRVAITAFHALFAARHLAPGDAYDVVAGVHHQTSEVRGPDDERRAFDLWTTAYTVGEAVRLLTDAGLEVDEVAGVQPGAYGASGVGLDDPELLLVARKPPRPA
jgi:SAM-dependent methyltransferase